MAWAPGAVPEEDADLNTGLRRPRRFLAIEAPGECLSLSVVRKLHGNNHWSSY